MTERSQPVEWATVNRHLQSVGTATCDVSHMILQADIMREEDRNSRAAEMLMTAARDVLRHRRLARQRASHLLRRKSKRAGS